MYDEILLTERMAELGLNFWQLSLRAKLHPVTVKRVVMTGKGHPESVKAVAKALGFKLPQIVKRHNVRKRKTA